ncbi:MAG: hypothetical protein M9939_11660 [Mesorhizobium sp.]|nr:hypothetical protein [Mesorhizobium sp.]MCO5161787.1 hypothetical protein [Mesorhizobium sp.]
MNRTDPKSAHYPIDPARLDLIEEFRRKPKGPHSAELLKVVHRMRWSGEGGRLGVTPVDPGRVWMLVELPAVRGGPIRRLPDYTFTSLEDAEWAVFKIRWEAITGCKIPSNLEDRP